MSRSPKEDRAIASFCKKGFRPEMSTYPKYRFTNKETGEVVTHNLSTLVDMYDVELKENSRERARLRRQEAKK